MALRFRCDFCETACEEGTRRHCCAACGGPLSLVGTPASFPREKIAGRPPSMWRYREALPAIAHPVSLGEPMTPLVPLDEDHPETLVKCEYCMPTGSYKDRGSALLASYLRQIGVREAVEDSSGNAGASLAAYAARARIRLKVFCPASASPGKLAQIRLSGAELVPVEGPRPRATQALLEYVDRTGALYASHLWHPLFIEGIKTLAWELCEQLDWQAPARILCPVGAGSILLGLYRGFKDLLQAGLIERLPRLVAVQAEHVSPVCRAFASHAEDVAPATDPRPTLAEGIALPAPVRGREVLRALRQSGGLAVSVSEAEIAEGMRQLGGRGFGAEPTSAVVWAGWQKARGEGRTVLVLSGHALKAGARLGEFLP